MCYIVTGTTQYFNKIQKYFNEIQKNSYSEKHFAAFFLLFFFLGGGDYPLFNTSTLYHPGCGSFFQTRTGNWYRKPMRVFSFVPIIRSDPTLIFLWKSALTILTVCLVYTQHSTIGLFSMRQFSPGMCNNMG